MNRKTISDRAAKEREARLRKARMSRRGQPEPEDEIYGPSTQIPVFLPAFLRGRHPGFEDFADIGFLEECGELAEAPAEEQPNHHRDD